MLALPRQRPYQLFSIDETPTEQRYASCLTDRQTVHHSTPVPRQVPISVGHNYSILAVMPKTQESEWPRWVLPCSVERVITMSSALEVAHSQVAQLIRQARVQAILTR